MQAQSIAAAIAVASNRHALIQPGSILTSASLTELAAVPFYDVKGAASEFPGGLP